MCERKRIVYTCSFMFRCTYSATPATRDPSRIHNLLGRCKWGQGKTCWFESCPCRSSEGARDLFYIKAKIVEGPAWKCDPRPSDFDLLSPCRAQLGLYNPQNDNIDSLLEKPCIYHVFHMFCIQREEKVQCRLLQVFLRSITNGENVL